jgi:hypothetical protein
VRSDLRPLHGKPLYRRDEFGLTYEGDAIPPKIAAEDLANALERQFGLTPRNVFVIADTLTLTFSEQGGRFVSLDAYTNEERWTKQPQTRPSGPRGALLLSERIDDRLSLETVPRYRFDDRESILSIGLGGRVLRHFEVGDDLFIGVADGELVEVVLTNLQIE